MKVFGLAVLTALLWGMAPALEKTGLAKLSPLTALAFRTIVIGIVLGGFVIGSGGYRELFQADRRAILYVGAGGLVSGLIGQYVYYHALKLGDVSRVVPIVAAYPLAAVLIAVIVLRESVTPGKIIGAVLVVLGVIMIRMDKLLWPR